MGIIRYGAHHALEDVANELLRQSLEGVTSQTAKRDILTPWKEKDRISREVYVPSGTPDPAFRQGMYHRVYNPTSPHLNSREGGTARGRRVPLREYSEDISGGHPQGGGSLSGLANFVANQAAFDTTEASE